ncbi:MAG: S1 RNA-binding domain-containing protein [Candidatus Pacebacteria bacterium]|nr:S1 RNA-binding domain-containing protein [Candidatus Paceibacterota bacterium]
MNAIKKTTNSPLAQVLKSSPELLPTLKEGDLVEGALLKKMPRAVYFDLKKFGTGVIYGHELSNAKESIKNLKIGDPVSAKVVDLENEDGYIELSLSEASRQKTWQGVKDLLEKNEEIAAKITAANSGGLISIIDGIKAFLPVSQLSNEHYPRVDEGSKEKILEELKKFIGQDLTVKIIDLNPRTGKLIISEKETASQDIKGFLVNYKAGDTIDGIISGIADFGAFVRFADNPKIEGLIHISELSHRLIENPKDIVKIDDTVKAQILEIKDGRVTLSLKSLTENPWSKVAEKYKAGETIKGTLSRFNPFGAFVSLDQEIQGAIHVSEFGSAEEMKKQLEVGKSYDFKIDSVKPEEKRIILKLAK